VRQRVVNAEQGKRLVESDADLGRLAALDRVEDAAKMIVGLPPGVDADRAEQARRLADPVALVEPLAQPLDARDVTLGVAALAACRAVGLEDPVALLPLAQRVRRDPRALRERSNVEAGRHRSGGIMPDYAPTMPEGDALHRAAQRLQVLAGQRVEGGRPPPPAATKQVAGRAGGPEREIGGGSGK